MNKIDKKILNSRILSDGINFWIFLFTYASFGAMLKHYNLDSLFLLPIAILIHILYFGLIPKLTNGYTFGGFITGMRLFLLDASPISIWTYAKRGFDIFTFYGKVIYTHDVKINNFYQLQLDTKYNITLLPNNFNFQTLDKKDNWQEVDYYFLYLPYFVKNTIIIFMVFSIMSKFIEYISKLFS